VRRRFLLLVATFGVAAMAASFNFGGNHAAATVPGTNTLISINRFGSAAVNSGTMSNGGFISADGRYMAFSTAANDAVASDTNSEEDVFVRNLNAHTTTRVSVSSSGVQANGPNVVTAISRTGRYIVFYSTATNLIDGTTVSSSDDQLYVRDTTSNTTTLVSQNSSGTVANGYAIGGNISSDGRFITFLSNATNLGVTVTNTTPNLYLLDRSTGTFSIVNTATDGSLINDASVSPQGAMSCDGSLIVFESGAHLVVSDPAPSHVDIYIRDLRSGNTLTDLTKNANQAAGAATISCNGDYIGFSSKAYNLDPAFTTSTARDHAYVYDRVSGTFTLADQSTAGTIGSSNIGCTVFAVGCVQISDTGIVVFPSTSSNLTSFSTSVSQIYVHNLGTGVTDLLSQYSTPAAGNLASSNPTISTTGSVAGYGSYSTNLVSTTDTNSYVDAFTSLTGY
jgi:hypothetical protein